MRGAWKLKVNGVEAATQQRVDLGQRISYVVVPLPAGAEATVEIAGPAAALALGGRTTGMVPAPGRPRLSCRHGTCLLESEWALSGTLRLATADGRMVSTARMQESGAHMALPACRLPLVAAFTGRSAAGRPISLRQRLPETR